MEDTTKKSAADEEELDYARQIAYEHDYVCDGTHGVGDLKQETDDKYAKEPYFLYKKRCQICDDFFVEKEDKNTKKEEQFRVSTSSPCYVCQINTLCTYCMCGSCYNTKIISGEKPKRVRV